MGPEDLAKLLNDLPRPVDARVLVGFEGHDDAGVYLIRDDLAMIQSIDVFGPVVDDPYDYGQIAAANSLSDIYAMGVTPSTAVAFAAFPRSDVVPDDVLSEILRGGAEKVQEAGCALIGGHTIRDKEPKYGLCVTGFAHPSEIVTNAGARAGDLLVLTKPLGSGILSSALKMGLLSQAATAALTKVMVTLNRIASQVSVEVGVNAMTDVTGFGFLGHLRELCEASGVNARVHAGDLPFMDGVFEAIESGNVPGGTRRNLDYVQSVSFFESDVTQAHKWLLADAQTSGGLLIAVDPSKAQMLYAKLLESGVSGTAIVGSLVEYEPKAPRMSVSH